MQFEKLVEMFGGGGVVTELGAFERQAVARKGIRRLLGDKLFQDFAA
jgi:hypothetical protein